MTHALAIPYQPINRRYLPSVRPAGPKRINGLRVSWFIIGSLFGIGMSFFLNLLVTQVLLPEYHRLMHLYGGTRDTALESLSPQQLAALEPGAGMAGASHLGTAKPAEPDYPLQLTLRVDRGDTLLNMLVDKHVDYDEAADAVEALRATYNPRRLRTGQEIHISLDKHPRLAGKAALSGLLIPVGPIETVQLARLPSGSFAVERAREALSPELTYAGGAIMNSLFESGEDHGIPHGVLAEIVKAYSYDVDFQREIHRGDGLEVLFERMTTADGDVAGYGAIYYAKLDLQGKPLKIYRYKGPDGRIGFYNEKGESVVKALLRTPVNGARISSGYGMRRHPILGYSKMHRGTDFAAPTGTPIYAAGDGTIRYKGVKGGYGNYIEIQHNGIYTTAYAHMSRFAPGIAPGRRVRQGEVIGYVGSTGRSTGPHLHYEVHKHGMQINPVQEKFKTGHVLAGRELAAFKQHITQIENQIASLPKASTKMASR